MWLFQYEDLATVADVCIHCNPSKPWSPLGHAPARPTRPAEGVSAEALKLYSFDRSDWEHDYKIWKRKKKHSKPSLLTYLLQSTNTTYR